MQNFKISIPKPCHEDWQKMTPQDKGRFCNACSKVVIDFTQMTEDEIIRFFQKHQNQAVCGHIKKTQLKKVYQPQNFLEKHYIHIYQNYRKTWIGNKYTAILSFLLLITGCQTEKKFDEIKISKNNFPEKTPKIKDSIQVVEIKNIEKFEKNELIEEYIKVEEPPIIDTSSPLSVTTDGVMAIEYIPQIEDSIQQVLSIKPDSILKKDITITSEKNKDFYDINIYPNPTQDKATIKYFLEIDSEVKIYLLNIDGHLAKSFLHETQKAGNHHLDIRVDDLPSGVYFYTIETSLGRESKRLVISK